MNAPTERLVSTCHIALADQSVTTHDDTRPEMNSDRRPRTSASGWQPRLDKRRSWNEGMSSEMENGAKNINI